MNVRSTLRLNAGHRHTACSFALALAAALGCGPAGAQDKPIASASTLGGKVRVDVLSLKRVEGNLVTLRWQVINEDAPSYTMTTSNARLVDLVARREYQPGLYSNSCFARTNDRATCWATFAAPPAGTKTLAVKFYEQFDLIMGVPVSD